MSDIEIAQHAKMKPIIGLVKERFGIDAEHLDPFGHYKAKLSLEYVNSLADKPDGKLILVTAISPTPPSSACLAPGCGVATTSPSPG